MGVLALAGRAVSGPTARTGRAWMWFGLGGTGLLALVGGIALRAGTHGAGAEALMIGMVALAAALLVAGQLMAVLQAVQGREAASAALAGLPPGHRVSGRIRVRGRGRPAVIDNLVVTPGGRAFAVIVDGSTRPPAPRDPRDGLGPLLAPARRGAEMVAKAAAAGVLPAELGLGPRPVVLPAILVARRPLPPGRRDGVWAFAADDAAAVLAGEASGS